MRFRLRELSAALIAASVTTFALAQQAESRPAAPTGEPAASSVAQPAYAEAPTATVATGNQAANVGAANAIVEALNADTSLKDTKVTVTPEETKILLTGVTPTVQQMGQILKIASQHAGDQVVVNGIATEEVFIEPNPTGEAAQTEQLADAGEATAGQAAGSGDAPRAGEADAAGQAPQASRAAQAPQPGEAAARAPQPEQAGQAPQASQSNPQAASKQPAA